MADSTTEFNFDLDADLAGFNPDARADAPMRPIPEGKHLFRWNFGDNKFLNEPFDVKKSKNGDTFLGVKIIGSCIGTSMVDLQNSPEEWEKRQVRPYLMTLMMASGTSSMTDWIKSIEGGNESLRAERPTYARIQEIVQELMMTEPESYASVRWVAQFRDAADNYKNLADIKGFEVYKKGASAFPRDPNGAPKHYWPVEIEENEYDVTVQPEVRIYYPFKGK